jgi:hypothetical protein
MPKWDSNPRSQCWSGRRQIGRLYKYLIKKNVPFNTKVYQVLSPSSIASENVFTSTLLCLYAEAISSTIIRWRNSVRWSSSVYDTQYFVQSSSTLKSWGHAERRHIAVLGRSSNSSKLSPRIGSMRRLQLRRLVRSRYVFHFRILLETKHRDVNEVLVLHRGMQLIDKTCK